MTPDQLVDQLCELELAPGQLRRDPRGRTWLPPQVLAELEQSPALRAELAEFVQQELYLFDDAALPGGAMFTARVMAQIPLDTGVDPARRRAILGLSYASAAAVGVAWLLRAGLSEATPGAVWESSWHAWLDALSVGGLAFALALLVTMAGLLWPSAAEPAPG